MDYNTVYELLENKDRWLQNGFSIDNDGSLVSSIDETAVKWCLLSAIYKVYYYKNKKLFVEVIGKIFEETKGKGPVGFNDENSHKTVLSLVQKLGI